MPARNANLQNTSVNVNSQNSPETVDDPLENLTGKQKAALVIVSMGSELASQIYKYLGEEDVEELTLEVARMGRATNEQAEATLQQFYKLCLTHKMMTDGGIEYARSVLEKAYGESAARVLLERISQTLQSRPFNFFSKGDPKALISLLQNERPQVIALIMSYMDSEQAALVMENLAEDKRLPTIVAMAKMDRVSPEAISIVEAEMKRKFDTIITSEDNMNLGGIDFVANIMNHIDRSSEKKIFDEMDVSDPDLSADIKDKMFVFEDILLMDDRSVQRFVRDCESKDIVFALKTANEDMKALFLRNMSKRMAETVQSDMENARNVRLRDVEEAQQRIVNLIRNLEDQGEVIITKGGDEGDVLV